MGAPYRLATGWPQLPDRFVLGNPSGLSVDRAGHLIVFCRGKRVWPQLLPMPGSLMKTNTVLVLDSASGKLLNSWGAGQFIMPHGLTVDADDNIWVTDVGLHQVMKFTHDGRRLLTLGIAGQPGNDSLHFNRPTDVAIAPDGCFYVSDGYRNSRVIKFSPGGRYLFEWGKKGSGDGEFDIPHGLCLDGEGNVYVADRENRRIEVFDSSGRFLRQFNDPGFGYICALAYDPRLHRIIAVDDKSFFRLKHRGSDILVLDLDGKIIIRFGRSGAYTGPDCWYHDLALGPEGTIYVGDILGNRLQKFIPDQDLTGGRYSK
jgi:peptidylamidoglycolate lyase